MQKTETDRKHKQAEKQTRTEAGTACSNKIMYEVKLND